ncbi:MAG: AMP-binding protein [Kiritimatiellae bacterium]|nr:AMP-binding protein [Kiritimatiellia bacterium]
MVKFFVKIVVQVFFWKPKNWRKGLKAKLESSLYSVAIRRRAKSCGKNLYILGPGVNVTSSTTIGDGAGFGKRVKILGDGPVSIGRRAVLAEDTVVYTQVHDYDHSDVLPFGWGFTYPETSIGDYAWLGIKCIVLPGARIGEGAIVQAGSVVMGVVPPCAIVAGNPAKVIGWRDVKHYNKLKVAAGETPVRPPAGESKVPSSKLEAGSSKSGAESSKLRDDRLSDIFCGVFSVLPEEAVAMKYKEHPAWDSAGQMALVAAIEREYGRSLSPGEIYRLRSYADAMDIVKPKAESQKALAPGTRHQAPGTVFDLDRDGTAVIDDGREVSYRELASLSADAVRGLEPRTVKVVVNGQDLATVALFVGCVNSGVVPLMVPATMDPGLLARLRATYEGRPTSQDLSLLLTTSGSTGSPKLVRISREGLRADNKMSERLFGFDAATRMTMILPICYAWGLSVACAVLEAGGTLVMTRRTVMDAELADVMLSSRATHLAGVPYMYEMLERFRFFERDFPALRGLLVSGGALAPALRRKFAESAKARGISFSEGYGQTETTGVMSTIRTDLMPERIGSIGKAGEGGRFRVDDGELVYEGPIVAMGYAVCAEDLLKGDEWKGVRRTGDLATIDADGYVTLTGRASRFLKIFGNRVSLDEVENLVKDGFAGSGCAATGADNDLHVFVCGVSAADVEKFLVAKLHFNATVVKVHVLDSIPLNANGKTDYPKLKGMCGK